MSGIVRAIAAALLIISFVAVLVLPSMSVSASTGQNSSGEWVESYVLWAGKNTHIGHAYIWNDADNIYVQFYICEKGWFLTEVHIDIESSVSLIPQKNGNPIPGHFNTSHVYEIGDRVRWTEVFAFDMDEVGVDCGDDAIVAAHAVVNHVVGSQCDFYVDRSETAWGGCMNFPGKNWARYICYEIECPC